MYLTLLEIIERLSLSIVFSGLIGIEREATKKPAGFRTHILVCVGATCIMLSSIKLFEIYKLQTTMDPARLGAQVVSGIGFLGAGTIIREGFNVKGLTTAASIWAVGCIGLAIGSGFYDISIVSTLLILLTLKIFGILEDKLGEKEQKYLVEIKFLNAISIIELINEFENYNINIDDIQITKNKKNTIKIKFENINKSNLYKLLQHLLGNEHIIDINSRQY